ncbi:MAG: DUF2066 domain-containing protein [Alphaproteobacteria bacterium]|nr:DUF2066 domain-containing protein [Alphaproteobacteria bacterium]
MRLGAIFVRCWLAAALAVAAALAPVQTAQGQSGNRDDEAFTVRGVAVDVTAKSAVTAREQALREAERTALVRLLERLAPPAERGKLPKVAAADVPHYIRDIEIADERASTVRYIASVTVRFRPAEVRGLLDRARIAYAAVPPETMLVIPLLQRAGTTLMWDEPNPWRLAWSERRAGTGALTLAAPLGDLGDLGELSTEQAAAGDRDRLGAIADRYGAAGAYVAVATLRAGAESALVLDVAVSEPEAPSRPPLLLNFTGQGLEAEAGLMARAVAGTAEALEAAWFDGHLRHGGGVEQRMVLAMPLGGLAEWVKVRERLGRVASILRSEVRAITPRHVEVEVAWDGDAGELADGLGRHGLALGDEIRDAGALSLPPGALVTLGSGLPVRLLRPAPR